MLEHPREDRGEGSSRQKQTTEAETQERQEPTKHKIDMAIKLKEKAERPAYPAEWVHAMNKYKSYMMKHRMTAADLIPKPKGKRGRKKK